MTIRRALVVDDSKAAGLALRRMLEQHSVTVDLADSGEAALNYLKAQIPDVIFMDHIMPGLNGLEATKAITDNPTTAAIPIVMYTSTEGDAYVEKAKAHGAVGVLPKPPKPAVLAQWMQQLRNGSDSALPSPAAAEPVHVVQRPAPAVAPEFPAMSAEQIETLARGAAESVVRNGTRTLITRALEEQLPQVRQDILARCETIAKQAAAEFLHARVNELANQLRTVQEQLTQLNSGAAESGVSAAMIAEIEILARAIAEQTATDAAARVASETARQTSEEISGARIATLATQLREELQNQLAALPAPPADPVGIAPDVLEQITSSACAAAAEAAAETARRVVQEAALRAADDIATHAVAQEARQAAQEIFTAHNATLVDQLKHDVAMQLAELNTRQVGAAATIEASVLEELKDVARQVAGQRATESAQKAVQDALQRSSPDLAKQAARMAARQLDKAVEIAMRAQTGRVYLLAVAAGAVGVFAAYVVHLLH